MLFGLFYSPASIIIIIFYANPLFPGQSLPSSSSSSYSIPTSSASPFQSLSLSWLDLALLGSTIRSGSSWRRLVQPFFWLDPTLKTICPLLSQSVIASTLPPVIRNIDPPLYPGNFPPFSAPGVHVE